MGCKGCLEDFLLALVMVAVCAFGGWALVTQPLGEWFGTVEHLAKDGTVKENPICLFAMFAIAAVFIVVVAVRLIRSEAIASNDPLLAPVARHGCGTAFAGLGVLAALFMAMWILSQMGVL